jgi:hypothetical protein
MFSIALFKKTSIYVLTYGERSGLTTMKRNPQILNDKAKLYPVT